MRPLMMTPLAGALLLLLGAPLAAQDLSGSYDLDGRPWFGGDAFEARLELTKTASGYTATHAFNGGAHTGFELRGEGRMSGDYLYVSFKSVDGMVHRLGDLGAGEDPTMQAYYRVSGDDVSGFLYLQGAAGSTTWLRESGKKLAAPPATSLDDEALRIPDRATFETLARRDNVPGAMGVREVKVLVTGVDTPNPVVHFINSNNHPYHYYFARDVLGTTLSLEQFNARTYFTDNRSFLAGSLIAHDSYEHPVTGKGLYTLEFWPTDPVKVRHVDLAYDLVAAALPFAADRLYYHPASETQQGLYAAEKPEFEQREVKVILTEDLFGNVTYSPLNLGESYGRLRVVDGSDPRPVSVREVVIFVSIPNDLSHVAGVITEAPQTPLSHVNLKAKQNDTPNAYVKGASAVPEIAALVGELVHYEVTPDGYVIEAATQAQVDAFFASIRPTNPQVPVRDLSERTIKPLSDLGNGDVKSVGAKAANLAELRKILPAGMVPDGYGVPFYFYDRFMRENGLYDEARRMRAEADFQADPAVREERLRLFRRQLRRSPMPADLRDRLGEIQDRFPAGQPIRARSSTNNEDLEGFNGAGLYDSNTHRPGEGHLENTIKQVWASLWNYRAFEEREFYRIDHDRAAMGVLLHPNFDDELANGVAVTKNIYDPNWPGFYVNVQVGESLVTNPDPGATPDEFLVAQLGPQGEYETQYVQHSSLLPGGQATVLSAAQIRELVRQMERIQSHFAQVYGRQDDKTFAMDIEFKTDANGRLVIKQARPWVD